MFPVRCYLGDVDSDAEAAAVQASLQTAALTGPDFAATMARSAKDLKSAVTQTVIEQAALNMGIQIALMFCGPIGMAAGALLSLTQQILGKVYQKEIQQIMAQTMANIQQRAAIDQQRIVDVANSVYLQELPNGQALAASNQTLSGLGDVWSSAVKSVGRILSQAPQKVVQAAQSVTKVIVKPVAQAITGTLIATGNRSAANSFSKASDKIENILLETENLASPINLFRFVTGQQTEITVKAQCSDLQNKAFVILDGQMTQAITALQSAAGRAAMDNAIAQAIRGSPQFAADVATLEGAKAQTLAQTQAQVNALQASLGVTPTVAIPAVNSGSGVLAVIGIAAAGAGAWLLAR